MVRDWALGWVGLVFVLGNNKGLSEKGLGLNPKDYFCNFLNFKGPFV